RAEVRVREPRRHLAGQHRLLNSFGPGTDFGVAGERHRGGLSLAMTLQAAAEENRGHVSRKRRGNRGSGNKTSGADQETNQEICSAPKNPHPSPLRTQGNFDSKG